MSNPWVGGLSWLGAGNQWWTRLVILLGGNMAQLQGKAIHISSRHCYMRAREMAQEARELDNLSLIPGTHIAVGENRLQKVVL